MKIWLGLGWKIINVLQKQKLNTKHSTFSVLRRYCDQNLTSNFFGQTLLRPANPNLGKRGHSTVDEEDRRRA